MEFSWLKYHEREHSQEKYIVLLLSVTFSLVWGVLRWCYRDNSQYGFLMLEQCCAHPRLCCNRVALKIVVAYRPVYYHLYKPWWRFSTMQSSYLYIFYLGCNFLFKCVADNFSHFPYHVTSLWDVLVFVTATPKYSNSYHQKYCRKTKGQWIAVIFKTLHVSCQIEKFMRSLFIMFITLSYKVLNWLM